MSPREVRQAVEALKKHREKVTCSPREARDFLVRAGILSRDGKRLAPAYR